MQSKSNLLYAFFSLVIHKKPNFLLNTQKKLNIHN